MLPALQGRPLMGVMTGRDRFRVRVLGCGDAFGSGGRFQTAFLLEIGTQRVLMDCGASTLVACRQAGIDPSVLDLILISHLHGDHFGGLPFLLLDQHFRARRRRPLIVAGPRGIADRLERLLATTFPGAEQTTFGFPLVFEELEPGDSARRIGPAAVRAVAVDHPAGAPALGLRIEAAGRTLAYSGDTQWTESLVDLADGSDLFICECYAYDSKIIKHMNYRTLRQQQWRLSTRRLVLTHLSADMLDRRADLDLEVLDDGMVLDL